MEWNGCFFSANYLDIKQLTSPYYVLLLKYVVVLNIAVLCFVHIYRNVCRYLVIKTKQNKEYHTLICIEIIYFNVYWVHNDNTYNTFLDKHWK